MNRTVTLLSQHQLSSLVATGVDYCIMIVCVSVFGLSPVLGTVVGALCGAVTSFTLGRRWVFDARRGNLRSQALRYALVSTVSLIGNAGGEWLLVRWHLQYVLARVLASTVVGIGWNFPMHRHFVFRVDPPSAPAPSPPTAPSPPPSSLTSTPTGAPQK
ncbi:MAG: CDP-diacylglycerol--glycerol-3-phosphate 3-phosphatidyltransferase [Myxococcales bacterium]|nr:CDP-diacylglycerol--glycerol-3-phosphate 3-phosphatidyltransferase [Myxococcales bacterium]